jgi:uncharacterized protein YdhG (YjbR/CyaY superfamily)
MPVAKSVDDYIRSASVEARSVLRKVRSAVREAAPDAEESISYGMPFYSYRGEVGVERRLCYFGLRGSRVGFYLRPKDLEPYSEETAKYQGTKSALLFPLDQPIPITLIKKLVRDAAKRHRARSHSVGVNGLGSGGGWPSACVGGSPCKPPFNRATGSDSAGSRGNIHTQCTNPSHGRP